MVALGGAAAFGISFAVQGPLSNYGAGLVIILTRPFTVGDTVLVQGVTGLVDEVTLAHTILIGEDSEKITIPNRKIVGEILVNSDGHRIVESQIVIAADSDPEEAITAIEAAVSGLSGLAADEPVQVGIHDFSFGGIILGLRYWVPTSRYYRTRYEVNSAAHRALKGAGIELLKAGGTTNPGHAAVQLSHDQDDLRCWPGGVEIVVSVDANTRLVETFFEVMWNTWDDAVMREILHRDIDFRGSIGLHVIGHDAFAGLHADDPQCVLGFPQHD